jgi:hypothetical protein
MHDGSARLIEYKVRADKIGEQEAAIREWIDAVKAAGDSGVSYTVLKAEDGLSFRHIVWGEDEEAIAQLQTLTLFKSFAEGIGARSKDDPTVTKLGVFASTSD